MGSSKLIMRCLNGTMNACLVADHMSLCAIVILIGQETLIGGNPYHRTWLFLRGELYLGNRNYRECIVLFTTEAEYIIITKASKEMLWMKQFLKELG